MRNIFGIFRIKPKKSVELNYNVPQVADKLRTALSEYSHKQQKTIKEKDPLFLRINIEKIDYVSEIQQTKKLRDILSLNLIKIASKLNIMPESLKVIDRPNHHLREPYFGTKRSKDKMEVITGFLYTALFTSIIGYFWARFRYDVYYRRYLYIYIPSAIIAFEVFDSKLKNIFKIINDYIPIDFDESHLQYILSRKTIDRVHENKLKKTIDELLDDPDMVELNKVLKQIR